MGLHDLNLKYVYDSDQDDILNDFYIPALSESRLYRRLAGSFSSSALAVAAKGVSKLVAGGGSMQLVVGAELRPDDVEAIIHGLEESEVIARRMTDDLDSIEDECIKDHVKALAWMVANGRLQIKVAIMLGNDGNPLDILTMEKRGIFHPKLGILSDQDGNIVTFGGSINESMMGWLYNDERFYVHPSWIGGFKDITDSDVGKFQTCWDGTPNKLVVLEVPTAYKDHLIKMAPPKIDELNLEKWYLRGGPEAHRKFNPNNLTPWICQQRAVEAVTGSNYKGILKMATGTGKTNCALFILERFLKDVKSEACRIMVLVPSGKDRLGGQWESFLRKNVSSSDYVFRFDAEVAVEERRDLVRLWKEGTGSSANLFVVVTIQSLASFPFGVQVPDFLIGDEVHEYGTTLRMAKLVEKMTDVKYRLGLSATPERFYDTEGTQRVLDFFGPIVLRYSIKDAQSEPKYPRSETVLANYLYELSTVDLTAGEEKKVKELTAQIGKNIALADDPTISEASSSVSHKVSRLLEERASIVKSAENKLGVLEELLRKRGKSLNQCIVYCENTVQLDKAENIFKSLGITSYVKYHYEIPTRAESLELFKEHNCRFILSINCLDQGIDMPSCQYLILLSGSTNPRQYIQRRGRVLRNYAGKPQVQIFDILAFPKEVKDGYQGLVKSQMLRAWEFISNSQSPEEKAKLIDKRMQYGISAEELNKEIEGW